MALETAYTIYKNRSTIKKFIKWLAIALAIFGFFVYMVIATVVAAVEGTFRPPKITVSPSSGPSKPAAPVKAKH
jgi:hypothetical protein